MHIEFYVDGSCIKNGQPDACMGVGIVGVCRMPDGTTRLKEWAYRLGYGSNQRAEIYAVHEALLTLGHRALYEVTVYSDSQYAIECLSGRWSPSYNRDVIDATKALIADCKSFRMVWLKGHAGYQGNERADVLAGQAARSDGYTRPERARELATQATRKTHEKLKDQEQELAVMFAAFGENGNG